MTVDRHKIELTIGGAMYITTMDIFHTMGLTMLVYRLCRKGIRWFRGTRP